MKQTFIAILVIFGVTVAYGQSDETKTIEAYSSEQDSLLNIAYETLDVSLTRKIDKESTKWFNGLSETSKSNALVFMQSLKYNAACIFSLANAEKEALSCLESALQYGYVDFEQFATDSDLDNIRTLPQYTAILNRYKDEVDLTLFSKEQLLEDFDLLTKALKEAHTGLYWYTTPVAFDSIVTQQRQLISNNQSALDFYTTAGRVVEAAKEGHCEIKLDTDSKNYLYAKAQFLPICSRFLDEELYALNEIRGKKGLQIVKINGVTIDKLTAKLFNIIPSDGFNETLKYEWLNNGKFSWFYSILFPSNQKAHFTFYDEDKNKSFDEEVATVSFDSLSAICSTVGQPFERLEESYRNEFSIIDHKTALLSLPDFYNDPPTVFHNFIDSVFLEVRSNNIEHLIVDVRKNEGGYEGYEDYLFAHLTDKPYQKYRYVQGSAFDYSFYEYTHINTPEKEENFSRALQKELYRDVDGRILRKPNFMPPEPVKADAYDGKLYILTSGLTYSGGSELASLVKAHRNATFIGRETGGGYYGQTSGFFLILTLPNTHINIRIPLLKFSVNVFSNEVPFGRGVIPDYEVHPTVEDILREKDTEMKFTLKHIKQLEE